ncbi:hypothetical protein [Lysobacter sp. F60174L2]|uniref:hypothetical protein n=1 Tax=Lysobacter sp. F60174L2 TaxID=3459295 RepID=UPI00403DE954
MAGKFMATVWALACGVLLVAAYLLLDANIMFAMMAAGLAVACGLVACACLLKPSARSLERASRGSDADVAGGAEARPDTRRRWGPR